MGNMAGIAYPSRAPGFTPDFMAGSVLLFYLFSVLCFCFVCLRPVSCVPDVVSVSGLSNS